MLRTTAGIDKLHITISTAHELNAITTALFGHPLSSFSAQPSRLKWYGASYQLRTTTNNVLVVLHTNPVGKYNHSHLIQINGLALSNSALNALRPLDAVSLLHRALGDFGGNISAVDYYIDVHTESVPLESIFEQSLPHKYKKYIRSPFLKDHAGEPTIPRILANGVYYGQPQHNSCQVLAYNKRLSPYQKVYTPDNALKFPWYRFEVRLRKQTAKSQTQALAALLNRLMVAGTIWEDGEPQSLQAYIAAQVSKYIAFVEPLYSRSRLNPLQGWWKDIIESLY